MEIFELGANVEFNSYNIFIHTLHKLKTISLLFSFRPLCELDCTKLIVSLEEQF